MPEIVHYTRTEYKLSELDPKARERAYIDWAQGPCFYYDWWEFVYEDAEGIGKILGIEMDRKRDRNQPAIWFSGFWSQGDGACFEGKYTYAKGSVRAIREYAPQDEDLHSIAKRLQAVQKKYFYKVWASVAHTGRYYHEHSTNICVDVDWIDIGPQFNRSMDSRDVDEIEECLRDFMRWIYSALEREYEYLTSEEVFEEACEANEYRFTETGKMI